jgi:phenylalanyl-tRNA synthetase beta chain
VLGLDEEVIEFEINPDRAYALSLRGIAREAALGFGAPFTTRPRARSPSPTATATRSSSRTPKAARSS